MEYCPKEFQGKLRCYESSRDQDKQKFSKECGQYYCSLAWSFKLNIGSRYLSEENKLTEAHDRRMNFIFYMIKSDRILIRHKRAGIMAKKIGVVLANFSSSKKVVNLIDISESENEESKGIISNSDISLQFDNKSSITGSVSIKSESSESETSDVGWNVSSDDCKFNG